MSHNMCNDKNPPRHLRKRHTPATRSKTRRQGGMKENFSFCSFGNYEAFCALAGEEEEKVVVVVEEHKSKRAATTRWRGEPKSVIKPRSKVQWNVMLSCLTQIF
jgi:hypothetical protein